MQEKRTDELDELLEKMKPEQLGDYYKDNKKYMADDKKTFSYYMKDVLAKEIKLLASMIISNPELIDVFLGEKVKLERGKVVLNFDDPPFDSILFRNFIALSSLELFKQQLHLFKKINKIKLFEDLVIYNENSISIIIDEIENQFKILISQDEDDEEMLDQCQPEAEDIMREIVIIFAETRNQKIR